MDADFDELHSILNVVVNVVCMLQLRCSHCL